MGYRIHDLNGDGLDHYFDTAAEAEAAIAATKPGASAPTKRPSEKPREKESEEA